MRVTATILVLLLCLAPAGAEDAPKQLPVKPPTVEQAADAVLKALDARDEKALKALAAKDEQDPWLIADELIARAALDALEAFARGAPRVDTAALLAYVIGRRTTPAGTPGRGGGPRTPRSTVRSGSNSGGRRCKARRPASRLPFEATVERSIAACRHARVNRSGHQ